MKYVKISDETMCEERNNERYRKLLEDFEVFLVTNGKSERTIREYLRDVKDMLGYLGEVGVSFNEREPRLEFIRKYIAHLKLDKGMSNKGVNRKISSLRGFLRFLYESGVSRVNLAAHLHTLKVPKDLPKALTPDEIYSLIEAVFKTYKNDFLRLRDRAIILMLYSTGTRISELVKLNVHDIDIEERTAKVRGKGNKERFVLFNISTREAILEYLGIRDSYFQEREKDYDKEALFLSRLGKRISPRNVQAAFAKFSKVANVRFNVTPHKLRHTFATHMLDLGADIVTIKDLLGHASLNTTQIYTEVSREHLRKEYKLDSVDIWD